MKKCIFSIEFFFPVLVLIFWRTVGFRKKTRTRLVQARKGHFWGSLLQAFLFLKVCWSGLWRDEIPIDRWKVYCSWEGYGTSVTCLISGMCFYNMVPYCKCLQCSSSVFPYEWCSLFHGNLEIVQLVMGSLEKKNFNTVNVIEDTPWALPLLCVFL